MMTTTNIEQNKPPLISTSWPREEQDLNLREWVVLKGHNIISRENTKSRRFSASNIKSFREETTRISSNNNTNINISSTASSPGYTLKDEIDPTTYSFTTALKALQVKSSGYVWDCLSPDGLALNSKWNEAEKYICNPLSGEVPIECLSAKTLSGRLSNIINPNFRKPRISVSGPLVYSSSYSYAASSVHPHHQTKFTSSSTEELNHHQEAIVKSPIKEEMINVETRDVGIQSTLTDILSSSPSSSSTSSSSRSPSPTSTPLIQERSILKNSNKHFKEDSSSSDTHDTLEEIEAGNNNEKRDEKEEVTTIMKIRNGDDEGEMIRRRKNKKEDNNNKQQKQKWKYYYCSREFHDQQGQNKLLSYFCCISSSSSAN